MRLLDRCPATLLVCLLLVPAAAAGPVSDAPGQRPLLEVRVGDGVDLPDDAVLPDAPVPPTALHLRVDGGEVELSWNPPATGDPDAYRIYRVGLPNAAGLTQPHISLRTIGAPLAQVPGGTTTYRDTTVDLAQQQYVYFVTAVRAAPSAPDAAAHAVEVSPQDPPRDPAHRGPTLAPVRQQDGPTLASASSGHENETESPSNPVYTGNLFISCPFFENNLPYHPPFDINWECFDPPPQGTGGEVHLLLGSA